MNRIKITLIFNTILIGVSLISPLQALDLDGGCPGATDVILSQGICVEETKGSKLVCADKEDGMPSVKVNSCTSGKDTSALKACFHKGDPCFVVHYEKFRPQSHCESAGKSSDGQTLAMSTPCENF